MRRRGVAMVLVLGASVVLLSAAAVVARSRVNSAAQARADRGLSVAFSVARASESAVLEWLGEESDEVVLPGDSPAPVFALMDARIFVAGEAVEIRIDGWDQHGMVPRRAEFFGLLPGGVVPVGGVPSDSGDPGLDAWLPGVVPCRERPDRLGGVFATHNPSEHARSRRAGDVAGVNINTAPAWLLRELADDGNAGWVDRVLETRRTGEAARVRGVGPMAAGGVRLIGSSPAWAFRTDVRTRFASVSVWSVYSNRGGEWVREQRFVVSE